MKIYTRQRGQRRRRQTRSKKYSIRRSRYGGASKRPSARASNRGSVKSSAPMPSPPPPQSKAPSRASRASSRSVKDVVIVRNPVPVSQSRASQSSRAGISKPDSAAAIIISNFPRGMDKFLKMVTNNYKLLNYESVKFALRQQISIDEEPAIGLLSINGIIFISYICGILRGLLNELSMTAETDVGKKNELLHKIKQLEKVISLLDDVGCSWGIRPYNQTDMDTITKYYRIIKGDEAGLQEYYRQLNEFMDNYFPVLKQYRDPSHVISSSMCMRLIPRHIVHSFPAIAEG